MNIRTRPEKTLLWNNLCCVRHLCIGLRAMSSTPTGRYVKIRCAEGRDMDALWRILEPVLRAGETYALPRDWDRSTTLDYWCHPTHTVYVAILCDGGDEEVVGTYFLHANQKGGGSHVANCGYVTLGSCTGRGIARSMCLHSLGEARDKGFRAMQYNFVVSSNVRALKLWQQCGFQIVGTLPGAFAHPTLGEIDVFVLFQNLLENKSDSRTLQIRKSAPEL